MARKLSSTMRRALIEAVYANELYYLTCSAQTAQALTNRGLAWGIGVLTTKGEQLRTELLARLQKSA